jgi:hypothetical protein
VAGRTLTATSSGLCVVAANQAGNGEYSAAAQATQTAAIAKAAQTITFGALTGKTFGDADFTINATASAGLAVSFVPSGNCSVAGATVHLTGAGSCTITASQSGDSNYDAAPSVPQTFAIGAANQIIFFGALANKTFGDPDFAVSASASSGLLVSFSASGKCTIAGATVHLSLAGSCTITASQSGSANYNPAADVSRTFVIANSTAGRVAGDDLRPLTGGRAELEVDADRRGPAGLKGTFRYHPAPERRSVRLESKQITAFGISADGHSATIAGVADDGRSFVIYVEDNRGEDNRVEDNHVEDNRRRGRSTRDVFTLWIDGVLETGDGTLREGEIRITGGHRRRGGR